MSICTFIASDAPLSEFAPSAEYTVMIDIDRGIVDDGGASDNYVLRRFDSVSDYTDMSYAVCLEWKYTEDRACRIVEYIKTALRDTDCVELWHVWLMDYYEFEDRPYIHRKHIPIGQLTAEHIREIDNAAIWNTPDKMYPQRPSFYCLTITR